MLGKLKLFKEKIMPMGKGQRGGKKKKKGAKGKGSKRG